MHIETAGPATLRDLAGLSFTSLRRSDAASRHATAPVFIVGSPRSGTTFVQSLISCSREIAVAPEHDFLLRFLPKYGDCNFQAPGTPEKFVADLFALPATRFWHIEQDRLLASLGASRPSRYADVVRLTYEHFARCQNDVQRWGAKVPFFALHVDVLCRTFPNVQVIHVVRDGRDVLASMRERTRRGARHFPQDARFAALRWRQFIRSANQGSRLLTPGHYLELRYEDLVGDVSGHVRILEQFLGCSMSDVAANHYEHAMKGAVVHSDEVDRYLHPGVIDSSIGRWRRELGPSDVQWFEAIAGAELRSKGYRTSSSPLHLRLMAGATSGAYSIYRRFPKALKPTIRQHVS